LSRSSLDLHTHTLSGLFEADCADEGEHKSRRWERRLH